MKRFILILMLAVVSFPLFSKEDWRGKVVDEKGEPVLIECMIGNDEQVMPMVPGGRANDEVIDIKKKKKEIF